MSEIVFAIPGDLSLPTGGYGYDRRLLAEWRKTGIAARHLPLPGSFPSPGAADLVATGASLHAQPPDAVLLIDGLAYGAFPEDLAAALAGRVVALVHHPLGLEAGLSPERAGSLLASEAAALRHAAAVVVTSPTVKRLLAADFGVPENSIAVAVPGVDPAGRARGSAPGEAPHLLAVGSVVPRKGYDVLVSALSDLADLPWRATIVGALDRAPDAVIALRRQIARAGLERCVTLAGAVDHAALERAYDGADLFVMPSLFEGYGMVLTEALARGLPILCTTGGAAAETVPDDAAVKVAPGDAGALATALRRLVTDPAARSRLADGAWYASRTLSRWPQTARIVAETCMKVVR